MKKMVLSAIIVALASQLAQAARPQAILGPGLGGANFRVPFHETTNRVLSRDTTYILTGWYFVDSTYSITIPAGTLLRGDSASGGSLIIKRGAKIWAAGTRECPIVFTSNKPAGTRTPGDWGGVILLGSAPTNQPTTIQIEGGFGTIPNTDAQYGGADPNDNTGVLTYCRIEFAGIAFAQDNEINGLTLGGVGRGTQLDHIQTSFANDDDVEMFGGTVDLKYYIGWRMLDDDIDTDMGWSGRIQFAYEKRDPNIFDASAPGSSEGFESDGEPPPSGQNPGVFPDYPHTNARVSNVTVVGPQPDTNVSVNAKFTVLARLRRATAFSTYNSILMAYPQGIDLRDTMTQRNAQQDSLQISHTSIQSKIKQIFEDSSPNTGNIGGFDATAWFTDPAKKNIGVTPRQPADVGLPAAVFNLDNTNNPIPPIGSEADTAGTSFQGRLAGDSFFDSVSYRGAFDPHLPRNQQWDWGWSNYDPQNYDPEATVSSVAYSFADSWNMISAPFDQVTNPTVSALFPGATSKAFIYNGAYALRDSFNHGDGYWLKFGGSQSGTVIGCLKLLDTLNLRHGWNLIGSVADTVPIASIVTIPPSIITSNFFGYSGSYQIVTSIEPGKAYWVKTSSSGQMILDGFTTPKPKITVQANPEQNSVVLTIGDQRGRSGRLYICSADNMKVDPDRYSAPPLPPDGGFDVRFSTDRILESYRSGTAARNFDIQLTGANFPIKISAASTGIVSDRITVVEMRDGKSVGEHLLTSRGPILISDNTITSLSLRVGGGPSVPTSFNLSESYPNPFNPVTHFSVDVPHTAEVEVAVYDLLGQKISTLMKGTQSAGSVTVSWDGRDRNGASAPSGMYVVRMTSDKFSAVRKIMLMK